MFTKASHITKDKNVWITRPGIEHDEIPIAPDEALADDDHFTTGSGVSCNKPSFYANALNAVQISFARYHFYAGSSIFFWYCYRSEEILWQCCNKFNAPYAICCQCYYEAYSVRPHQTHYTQIDVHFQHRNFYLTGWGNGHFARPVRERTWYRTLVETWFFNASYFAKRAIIPLLYRIKVFL